MEGTSLCLIEAERLQCKCSEANCSEHIFPGNIVHASNNSNPGPTLSTSSYSDSAQKPQPSKVDCKRSLQMKLQYHKMKSKQAALEVQQVKCVAASAHLQIQDLKTTTTKSAFEI